MKKIRSRRNTGEESKGARESSDENGTINGCTN
jgi:hypothetical protein